MKLLINTAHQRFGGAVQVALSFIYECRNFPEHEYHVWVGPGVNKSLHKDDFPSNFHFTHFDFGIINLPKAMKINRTLRSEEQKIKPDVVIATSGPSYFHSVAPQIIGFNLPLYIYPESPDLKKSPLYQKLRLQLKKLIHYYFFKRDAIAYVVQTEDVNQRVQKALKTTDVYTISNTHNGFFNNWSKLPDWLPLRKPDEIRLVTISAWYDHKNLDLIPNVVRSIKSKGLYHIKFITTLPPEDFARLNTANCNDQLVNIGPIRPEECPSLYSECDFMFLPTLAECFSASYPEAMVMGKPIITTDLGFARSICGNAAIYFKPTDAADAAYKIIELSDTPQLQAQLVESGKSQLTSFDNAQERASKYLALCEKIMYERKNN